jgi:amino-acid N-acetyltransferase
VSSHLAPTLEPASAADVDALCSLLTSAGLPADDVGAHVEQFILARSAGAIIGSVALELAGPAALLRSLCVSPSQRGRALGARLLSAIETRAAARGVRELYLLTTSAAAFFERHGFAGTARQDVPDAIRDTAQFRTLCPASAVCMRKLLLPMARALPPEDGSPRRG